MSTPNTSAVPATAEPPVSACEVDSDAAQAFFRGDESRSPEGLAVDRHAEESMSSNDRKHQSNAGTVVPESDALPEAEVTETIVESAATPVAPLDRKALVCLLVQHFSR